jgi:hypothetical protein
MENNRVQLIAEEPEEPVEETSDLPTPGTSPDPVLHLLHRIDAQLQMQQRAIDTLASRLAAVERSQRNGAQDLARQIAEVGADARGVKESLSGLWAAMPGAKKPTSTDSTTLKWTDF